jgi:predicted alpha/beta hydrolase family esterase
VAEAKAALNAAAKSVTLVASDKDGWIPRGIHETYAQPLNLEPVILPGTGHITLADGFGAWAGVKNWVNDKNADLSER